VDNPPSGWPYSIYIHSEETRHHSGSCVLNDLTWWPLLGLITIPYLGSEKLRSPWGGRVWTTGWPRDVCGVESRGVVELTRIRASFAVLRIRLTAAVADKALSSLG
jgi:hypothetical protein